MRKRLQVLLDEDDYQAIQRAARRQRVTVAEWTRRALRKAVHDQRGTVDAKLRAIADTSRHQFPTADIGVMIREIGEGASAVRDTARTP